MQKCVCVCLALILLLSLCGCTPKEGTELSKQDPTVARTFEKGENGDDHTWVTYYEMSDGTWKTDSHTYKCCLELSGEIPGSDYVWEFTVLSNQADLTFEDALWASGISSNLTDYFSPEEARIVRTNFNVSE